MAFWDNLKSVFIIPEPEPAQDTGERAPAEPEQRGINLENPTTPINAETLAAYPSALSQAGVTVNEEKILSLPAFWRAVQIVGGVIASMPFEVYRIDQDDNATRDKKHPVNRLVSKTPSPLYTRFDFMQTLVMHLMTNGNFYALIRRDDSYRPVELTIIEPSLITVEVNSRGELRYMQKDKKRGWIPEDVLHVTNLSWSGYMGMNIPQLHRDNFGMAIANRDYGTRFYSSGASISGVLRTDRSLNLESKQRLAQSWNQAYSGTNNAGKTAILDEGMEYNRVGLTPGEAQFGETKKLSISDIARITGVPQFLLEDLDRATFNNIEHLTKQFITYTIYPFCKNIQEEFSRKLLRTDEQTEYEIRFNLNTLMQADTEARGKWIDTVMKWGVLNRDEVRRMEGFTPIADGTGQAYYVPMNMIDPAKAGQQLELFGQEPTTENDERMKFFESIKSKFDAYGVGVRAGAITPQLDDELSLREEAGLPPASDAVKTAWKEDQGFRRPITLKLQQEVQKIEEDLDEPQNETTDDNAE